MVLEFTRSLGKCIWNNEFAKEEMTSVVLIKNEDLSTARCMSKCCQNVP